MEVYERSRKRLAFLNIIPEYRFKETVRVRYRGPLAWKSFKSNFKN